MEQATNPARDAQTSANTAELLREAAGHAVLRELHKPDVLLPPQQIEQIPVDVLRQHDGKWIVWDQEARRVVGVGDTFEEAEREAETRANGHELRFHHSCWMAGAPLQARNT